MKIVEALKKVKYNRQKMDELCALISKNSAHMESQQGNTPYNDPKKKVKEWVQSIHDTQKESATLLARIQKTNLKTKVTIEVEENKPVTKTISEWVYRRREGVDIDILTYSSMKTSLQQKASQDKDGNIVVDNVVYNYSTEYRDKRLMTLSQEKTNIDSALEIINATTDLLELE